MPFINIGQFLSFAGTGEVLIHQKSLELSPQELYDIITLAFSHIKDRPLVDADCGGRGPLSHFLELTYEDYLKELRAIEVAEAIAEAGITAKRFHAKQRRSEFNSRRSTLVLAMLDSGIPYVCAIPECGKTTQLTVDHIKALSRGGTDALDNLRFLCLQHNCAKGDRDKQN